jgi:RNA polymerase sigma factor (sigma-70 family)
MSDILETTPKIVAIFVENHRALLAVLERRVGSRAVAEELLQDAFVRSAGRLSADDEGSVMAWFYRTVKNAAVDYHRRRKTANKALEAFAAEPAVESDEDFRAAVCQCVAHLAETLKPEYAEALKRIELDGISVKDYAAEVGLSANNAGVRVFRARAALRSQLTRSCGSCATHGCLDCTCGAPSTS